MNPSLARTYAGQPPYLAELHLESAYARTRERAVISRGLGMCRAHTLARGIARVPGFQLVKWMPQAVRRTVGLLLHSLPRLNARRLPRAEDQRLVPREAGGMLRHTTLGSDHAG